MSNTFLGKARDIVRAGMKGKVPMNDGSDVFRGKTFVIVRPDGTSLIGNRFWAKFDEDNEERLVCFSPLMTHEEFNDYFRNK